VAFGDSAKGSDSRSVVDLLAGFTQVMSRRWITQVSWNYGRGSGYHSDPYKIVSVVNGSTGLLTGDGYINEARPRSRSRHSLFLQSKWHLTQDVVDTSYRYYRDDWGITAHTLDLRYRVEIGGGLHLEPQVRSYRQSAADFWRGWLVEGRDWSSGTQSTTLEAASADPRLAEFNALTVGLKFGMPLAAGSELSLRLASYRQKQRRPADAPGALRALDIAPELKATTVVVGYTREF
jgi:hypothetical protein